MYYYIIKGLSQARAICDTALDKFHQYSCNNPIIQQPYDGNNYSTS
jgi:hypothetical protein